MKILATGANGQLGFEITRLLAEKKDAVFTGVDVDSLDICDYAAVEKIMTDEKFDTVINCAAFTAVDLCESQADDAFKVNALGARNLAIACEKAGAALIHVSTDYVFSGDSDKPYREWDLCNPISVYGKSKLLGEQYVRDLCSRYFIVRTSWLYGRKGKNFVKSIIKAATEKGFCKVVNDQFGTPTNAEELAAHILKLAGTREYGIYHATGSGVCTWCDFAKKIVEYAGIDAKVEPCTTAEYPTPAGRPKFSVLDNMALRNTVGDGFKPWEDSLKDFIKEWKDNI